MFCLDWDSQDILIYGNERNDEYQRIELVLTPCNYLHTHLGYKDDKIHPECVADLEKQIEYLGPLDFVLYHTEEVFVPNGFDEHSIRSQSVIWNQQVDQFKPNWINTLIQKNQLSDETQIFQFGYSEDRDFHSFFSKLPEASAWNKFPSEQDPLSRYKFTSIEVNFSADQQYVNR